MAKSELNYDELIEVARTKHKWRQGTVPCVAFARGAEYGLEVAARAEGTFRFNASRSVAVGAERFISDFTHCPRGVKVQLLNPGGVALYGVYDGDPQWQGWYPVPGAPE